MLFLKKKNVKRLALVWNQPPGVFVTNRVQNSQCKSWSEIYELKNRMFPKTFSFISWIVAEKEVSASNVL